MRAFEAAARHESFTRAADELSVTQAAVSHQVRLLEEVIGIALFKRSPGGVKLTDKGKQYFIAISNGFAILMRATEEVYGADELQTIRISAQPNIASRWLIPRLPSFHAAHPNIIPIISFSGQDFDFKNRTFDVAIRYGYDFPDLSSHLLFHPQLTPVFSPTLASDVHAFKNVRQCALLRARYAPNEWRLWLDEVGLCDVDHTQGPMFDSTLLALDAARGGLGVALGRLPILLEDLRDGTLIAPYDVSVQPVEAWHLVYPDSARTMPTVAAFRSWILDEAKQTALLSN